METVAVGRIGPAHGVRGEVFVEPWTDDPQERFTTGSVLTRDNAAPLTVASARMQGARLVLHFADVVDRAGADALRGSVLFVDASTRPVLDGVDDFYDTDLIGLRVITTGGVAMGAVSDVVHAGGADYLVVPVAGTERLVPFVAAIVPSVDLAAGTVTIDPPAGLFDL